MRISLLLLLFLPIFGLAQNINHTTVSIKLLEKIEANPNEFQPTLILLQNRVDLEKMVRDFKENNISVSNRPKILINALQNKTKDTQVELLELLANSNFLIEESIRSFWITNMIYVEALPNIIAELSHRNDVEWIGLSGPLEMESVESVSAFVAPNSTELGLEAVGAPFMWGLGYTGYGQLAFTNDTGVDRFHPTYESKYRGLYADLEASWFEYDSVAMAAIPGIEPHDCNGHGTHVNGTILGLDRLENDTIGVAFNSQWIGAAILCGVGTVDNVAAFEWSLNPDGNIDTYDDIPDVINNSWYDPSLDTLDCISLYVPILEAMEAAGIAVIFSAGNAGSGPMSITQPHNININLVNAFTVGALNGNNAGLGIANFSSRGPSHCGGEGSLLIKPEVSAPGVNVRSARPNGTYGELSGTSMAAPHVSGCILLLKEAFPNLTGKELKEALYFSCIDLGEMGEDNTYGMGIINVENAYNYLLDLGHTPVSPYRNNDVLLIDFQTSDIGCENEIGIEILVENAGTDSLFSFQVAYEAAGISSTFIWNGAIAVQERTRVILPILEIIEGEFPLIISLSNPNNSIDERPLNNKLVRKVSGIPRPYINAFSVYRDTVCENSNALLQAEYEGNGSAEFLWYDTLFDGNLLGTGDIYLTGDLTESTTIYATANFSETIGEPTLDINTGIAIDSLDIGLEFDAHSNFTIKSVLVYAPESGVRLFGLKDKFDDFIESKALVVGAGFVRIDLNFEVPKGKGYVLEKRLGKPILSSSENANFPYETIGVCTINKSAGFPDENQFPIFLDWEIEYENPCLRTPIHLEVVESENLPTADFTSSVDTINLFLEDGWIEFFDNSTDATEWKWNFGNGNTSNETNPNYTFTEIGEYTIVLTVLNSEGCHHSVTKEIVIIDENPTAVKDIFDKNGNILVYPNPVSDNLQIQFSLDKLQNVDIKLINAVGKIIAERNGGKYYEETIQWDFRNVASGVYYLVFEVEGTVILQKVVKI